MIAILFTTAAVVILLVGRVVREPAPFSVPGVQLVPGSRRRYPIVAFSQGPSEWCAHSLKPFPNGWAPGLVWLSPSLAD